MMVGSNLKDSQLQQIVDKTILFHDKDGDGKISFEEFCEVRCISNAFWIQVTCFTTFRKNILSMLPLFYQLYLPEAHIQSSFARKEVP